MAIKKLHIIISMVVMLVNHAQEYDYEELLKVDASLWPGHLEPFGSKQRTVEVDVVHEWPEPLDFFKNYVEKNRPVAFKGLAKRSPAYKLFTDQFLQEFPGADKTMITAEPNKKEIRQSEPKQMSFKEFIQRYHNESLYMVNSLPEQLRKYVLMPASLRCDDTKELLQSQVTWFSSGGTKSVLHNDDVDNINCLYRGSKELLFIEYNQNKKFVPIDRPEGGYSSLDVDKVDYTKFPMLRHVDKYHHVTMEEGDCLFIPYHWFHQVNSIANAESGQNLAVNVWFSHVFGHRPVTCDLSPDQATLDKYSFQEDERENRNDEETEEEDSTDISKTHPLVHYVSNILDRTKSKKVSWKLFTKAMLKHPQLNQENLKVNVNEIPDEIATSFKNTYGR